MFSVNPKVKPMMSLLTDEIPGFLRVDLPEIEKKFIFNFHTSE